MGAQPTGTITFLFTDIVGSSALWDTFGEEMALALVRHDAILEQAAASHNGYVFKRLGDGFCIAFDAASNALQAAIAGQAALLAEPWGATGPLKVRMGLHTGEAETRDGDYFGPAVNRASRIQGLAHGGQILLSQATRRLLAAGQSPDVDWLDLGRHELAGLLQAERIYLVLVPGLPSDFPPIKSAAFCPNNLPLSPSPFVGRAQELAQLEELLDADKWRLITIVGPGGMGKSRLALELARRQITPRTRNGESPALSFPDGVFFVALAAVEARDEIPPAMNQALGFQPLAQDPAGRSPWQQLLDYLGDSQTLLVLDNFEQLTESAEMVAELVSAAPKATVVVTSREQLSLRGEQLFTLSGMRYPAALDGTGMAEFQDGISALTLLMQSCERVDPQLEWSDQYLEQAIHICQLLDGMPLALELASGWVEMLSLTQIAAEIQRDLDFLQTDVKDFEARHRSVAAVFEGTWSRLEPNDQELFARLCIFRGGFTRTAAQEVAGASLLQLARLVRCSLLQHDRDLDRYQIHRLLRLYGEHRLSADIETDIEGRDKHCTYYCQQMEVWGRQLRGPHQMEAMANFDLEVANCRAAWSWAVNRRALRLVDRAMNALGQYCTWRLLPDQLESSCEMAAKMLALEAAADSKRVLANVLVWNGWFRPVDEDRRLVKQSLGLLQEAEQDGIDVRTEKAFVLGRFGLLNRDIDRDLSYKQLKTALALAEAKNAEWLRMMVLGALVHCTQRWAMRATARKYSDQKTELHRQLQDRRGLAESLQLQGINTMYTGDFAFGRSCYEESIHLSRELSDKALLFDNLGWSASLLTMDGRFEEASIAVDEQLSLLATVRGRNAWPSGIKASILVHQGDYDAARALLEEALQTADNAGEAALHNDLMAYMGTSLLGLGRRREAVKWLKKSLSVSGQGQLFLVATSSYLAIAKITAESVRRAISAARTAQATPGYEWTIPPAALYYLNQGRVGRSVELYALASLYGVVANSVWYEDTVGQPIAEAAAKLPLEIAEAARTRGAERELEATFAELAAEFDALEAAAT